MRSPEQILAEMDARGSSPMTVEYQEVLRRLIAVAEAAKALFDTYRTTELYEALAALEADK